MDKPAIAPSPSPTSPKPSIPTPEEQRVKLLRECRQMLQVISNQPYCLSRLQRVKNMLVATMNYKSGRTYQR